MRDCLPAEDIEDPFEAVQAALRTTLVAVEGDPGFSSP